MAKFKAGDKVVHLGGTEGVNSPSRGMELIILEGPLVIQGWRGVRYIVDRPICRNLAGGAPDLYHANEDFLLKLI